MFYSHLIITIVGSILESSKKIMPVVVVVFFFFFKNRFERGNFKKGFL